MMKKEVARYFYMNHKKKKKRAEPNSLNTLQCFNRTSVSHLYNSESTTMIGLLLLLVLVPQSSTWPLRSNDDNKWFVAEVRSFILF